MMTCHRHPSSICLLPEKWMPGFSTTHFLFDNQGMTVDIALNAGHEAEREELVAAGLVPGKHWLAITDRDVRTEHSALNNVVVPTRADFSVASAMAPYPGHWNPPPEQRINCRCTTISIYPG